MAQQIINIGSAPNDGTGDPNRTAWDKTNDNFTELYVGAGSAAGGLWNYNKTDVDTTTAPVSGRFKTNSGDYRNATQIAIHGTTIQGISRVNTMRSLLVGDIIQCQDSTNGAAWCRYVVQALPIDNTTWFQINVTLETDGGVASGDNQEIIFAFTAANVSGGGSGVAAEYLFNGTVAAPPASGQIRLNNATQSSATIAWVHNVTVTGVDIKHILGATQVGAKLIIQDKDDSSKYAVFQIASALVDHTTYWDFPVTFVSGGSALPEQRALFSIQAGASGGAGTIAVNTTPITGGASGSFLYDNAGTVGERTPTQATAALDLFSSTLKGLAPLSGGGTANFLRADGTWATPAGTTISPPQRTVLTSGSGTYSTPAGTTWLEVVVVGGGAGGGGGNIGGTGTQGQNSSFGTLIANGATANSLYRLSGAPGTASGGNQNISGGSGQDGWTPETSTEGAGGQGGSTIFGGAGGGGGGRAGGNAAANTGGGGGGGGISSLAGTVTTGAGGSSGGAVQTTIASPAASYAYTVGAAGNGGSAGSNGFAGGNGGSGVIIVTAHFGG